MLVRPRSCNLSAVQSTTHQWECACSMSEAALWMVAPSWPSQAVSDASSAALCRWTKHVESVSTMMLLKLQNGRL